MQQLDPGWVSICERGSGCPVLALQASGAGRSEDLGVCDFAVCAGLQQHDLRK